MARIVRLALRDYRNVERAELALAPEGVVIVGENGHGKTNLLEAAYYLSILRSMRGARDVDLVRFGAQGFFIDGAIDAAGGDAHEISVGFERAGKKKRVRRDGVVTDRLSDALGTLPAVTFSPADVEIVAGAPSARRRFLDVMLALSSRGYLTSLQQYRGALDRRNAVLRELARAGGAGRAPTSAVEVWERPLSEHGAALVRARRAWVRGVGERFAERCQQVGERGQVELNYVTEVNPSAESVELALAQLFETKRAADVRFGQTQSGPHRDDLLLQLGGHDLRTFGSAGQQRTAAIVLRTLEADTLRSALGTSPVFLLDDPFAELDEKRSARVLALLSEVGFGQIVLAVPRDSDIPRELTTLDRVRIASGVLAQAAVA